jgi:hypothetical protein
MADAEELVPIPLSELRDITHEVGNALGVGHRAELAQRVLKDTRFSEPIRAHVLRALTDAGADELPIVLLVDRGEGLVAIGVRRERGEFVSES